ncbi:MAG: tRNA (N(6)-L-threonylcarbamoyladenosine(37)-C(2))-methylthiotransferase MtaB [Flavobacteriales bacterium]|nr:tRNA (N(6)-L-threonylcarbamoyladenosine(37)-C(2))-methylthiotransferase MtaB [Flavobacteriales bacterium]MCW8912116.1 tRNA (N(6)-L-threonylcarbamoyladenosine(37)-C(2))-methylthiotransferase MtaB [Flavobacteriales bacterium]MCW8936756.1 tRNA (N(6)-L-threonylcarbamoyladenosine(37)-C(2))-methylthiotransferase MtaB [Flavobacteriales bacterium]MCW8939884.1 tRNA (N(6)-L-threonylcarbamoyladenosine(37)-C(2))-methylthiotransferase MtaB [Flavobacteriales bacterium]MCW8967077.1 tRNA (N(6)-L-threonylcar
MNPTKKVALYTLGCKLNFSETSSIARMFQEEGFARVDFNDIPDVFVINTCSVTENADKKCKQLVKKAKKINPDAFVAIIGCYAQLKPEEIAQIHGVNMVLGAAEKFKIVDYFNQQEKSEIAQVHASKIKEAKDFIPSYSHGDRTRSFLKIQDGCDYFCTFCTIPLARGKSRNQSIAETVKVAEEIAKTNIKEVVLTGVNIGDFGQGEGNEDFFQLVQALDKVDGINRYRISSIEPNLLSNDIIDFVSESDKFMPHFHIPLQSGSNKILKMMRRKYLKELYSERVYRIKEKMPHACIGVDVIVGFPDETDEDFLETYNFLNELPISYLHVFTYSERQNTTAIKLDNPVPKEVRSERSKMLHILSEKKKRYFYEQFLGKSFNVLLEAEQHEGFLNGFTENYIKVKVPYETALENTIQQINISTIDSENVAEGELILNYKLEV